MFSRLPALASIWGARRCTGATDRTHVGQAFQPDVPDPPGESRCSQSRSVSRPAESGMSMLILGDEREDFVAMIEEKEPDGAHAKAPSRKGGPPGTRSRYSHPSRRTCGLPRLRPFRLWASPFASVLLSDSAALRELIRSPKPVAGLGCTGCKPSRAEFWDFEFAISSFLRISDLGAAAGRGVRPAPRIFARRAESDEPPFLDFESRVSFEFRISCFGFNRRILSA